MIWYVYSCLIITGAFAYGEVYGHEINVKWALALGIAVTYFFIKGLGDENES